MPVEVVRVPAERLPPAGPPAVVVAAAPDADAVTAYLAAGPGPLPAGRDLAAILRSEPLFPRDAVEVGDAGRDGDCFTVAGRLRRHEGPVFGNETEVALARVPLGALPAGRYELGVVWTVEWFGGGVPAGLPPEPPRTHTLAFEVR